MEKNKLKELVKSYFNLAEPVEEMAAVKLVDGTEISFEGELVDGTEIFVVDAEGEKSPITDATYELEDGTTFTTKDGKVVVEAEEMASEGPSAYFELPVGQHEIDGKIYTVEEVTEQEGTENEYKRNVIVSIVPVSNTEEMEEEVEKDNFSIDKIADVIAKVLEPISQDLESLKTKFSKLETEEGSEPTNFSKVKENETKLSPERQYVLNQLKKKLNK